LNSTSSKFSRWEYQNIALAAVAQCASSVDLLARKGQVADRDIIACVNPLLVFDPQTEADVYPDVSRLSPGLNILQDIFSNENFRENTDLVRYILGMLLLRNKLDAEPAMQNAIRAQLSGVPPFEDTATEDALDANLAGFATLARVYQDTISTLPYRVHVKGRVANLQNEQNANKIRALLLAGIRSAVLWQQLGGKRWQLLLYRKRVKQTVDGIRKKLISLV